MLQRDNCDLAFTGNGTTFCVTVEKFDSGLFTQTIRTSTAY